MTNKGYWVFQMNVSNSEGYKAYQEAAGPVVASYGGRFIARGGRSTVVEGSVPGRTVILEFKDYDTALACWNSPEYSHAKSLRAAHAAGNVVIIEGYDGEHGH
ncbi:MAG: DUF1330 domain-containing protein [Hyphomicrobiaceae bacterium]|nr:DUF1330 domain-containing protein [Hyphomicrobiaceae bacterium]